MIRAIREGRKTQTRRLIKLEGWVEGDELYETKDGELVPVVDMSRYHTGEMVYVKEGIHRFNEKWASYESDCTPVMFFGSANRFAWSWDRDKLSPMFLPWTAARTFLLIKSVRPERLQEITPDDVELEGLITEYHDGDADGRSLVYADLIGQYAALWDSINTEPGTRWVDNPGVFRYEFEVIKYD